MTTKTMISPTYRESCSDDVSSVEINRLRKLYADEVWSTYSDEDAEKIIRRELGDEYFGYWKDKHDEENPPLDEDPQLDDGREYNADELRAKKKDEGI